MTSAGPTSDDRAGTLPAFLRELAASFRRFRPQGSLRWNFSDAWVRLERSRARLLESFESLQDQAPAGAGRAGGGNGQGARVSPLGALERARARLRPILESGASQDRQEARWRELTESLGATLDALRYLTARVEALEDAFERRRRPVDGLDWLAAPQPLGQWVGPVSDRLAAAVGGPVLHAECGEGELALGLRGDRVVEGVEPRSAAAWTATEAGLRVHPMPVMDHLATLEPESLGALVLSGVVDRLAAEDLLALVELATGRLQHGGALVVIGTDPEAARPGPPAGDLLPGRPLHPETWALLLERAGYFEVAPLQPAPGATAGATFAVGGRRP